MTEQKKEKREGKRERERDMKAVQDLRREMLLELIKSK